MVGKDHVGLRQTYSADEIQQILCLSKSGTYDMLKRVYRRKEPFVVIKIGKSYRVLKDSFDSWFADPKQNTI